MTERKEKEKKKKKVDKEKKTWSTQAPPESSVSASPRLLQQ